MNKSKIEWCDHSWNPITGCLHGCEYCYAKRITHRFSGDIRINLMAKGDYVQIYSKSGDALFILDKPMQNETGEILSFPFGFRPTFHRYRLTWPDKAKKGSKVFVGSMTDLFGQWVPDEWIYQVFTACKKVPRHTYIFLTKFPERYISLDLPDGNYWYGTTITSMADAERINFLPACRNTFLSIEPIHEDVSGIFDSELNVDWIIIGAETGYRQQKITAKAEWIYDLVAAAKKYNIPIFMKDSLISAIGEGNMIRNFPESLQENKISEAARKKYYTECITCGKTFTKNKMINISARSQRRESFKSVGYMCEECFRIFCTNNNCKVPDLALLKER